MNKRDSSFLDASAWPPGALIDDKADRRKKRRSRWGQPDIGTVDKAFIPGMPTALPQGLDRDQEQMYLIQLQIEEISRRLRTGDLGIAPNPEDRSPSPEPIYNSEGKRLNTREYRTRKKLEEERHSLVQQANSINPEFKPPADYKPPVIRVSDKVMIPQEEHPDINFVGLLIGPRGNTLKNLEKDTGAKIIIRGKGSVKEGKIGRKDGQPLPGEDEPLHAYVTANNPENVKKAVEKIKEIIRQGIEVPEGQNDLRRQQLRELALLNGTLRENDGLAKLKQLQQAQNIVTNTILCTICGGTGHIAQDCKQKRPGDTFREAMQQQGSAPPVSAVDKAKMDSEYMSLMAELGEGPPPSMLKPSPPQFQQPPHRPPHFQGNAPMHHPRGHDRPPFHHNPNMHGHHGPHEGPNFRPHHHNMPPERPPFHNNMPPSVPWQHRPPTGPPSQHPPKPLMNQGPPPVSMPSQPPMGVQPGHPPTSAGPPPGMMQPPWQQQMPPSSVATSQPGMGPPALMAPPPPPPSSQPPTSSAPSFPWQQQQQPPNQSMGVPPPPPPSGQNSLPWQQGSAGPVPPPPGPPSNMPPWQQGPHPVPPPPPPGAQNFNPVAPPPPPPNSQQMGMGIPLGVPPPPPPN